MTPALVTISCEVMRIKRKIKRGLTVEYLVKLSRRRVKDEV